MNDTLLIIEDEALLRNELKRHFGHEGWRVEAVASIEDAQRLLFHSVVDPLVILSDMSLPDGNALDLLERARERATSAEWIFLTGYGSIADSVRGLRLGACDFLEKPCDLGRLDLVVAGAARSARAQRRLREQGGEGARLYAPDAFVGSSPTAERTRSLLARLAEVPFSAILLAGETGTGKGLAARIIHYSGPRSSAPLIEINCAALPRELLESELFGHEPGAFTGAKGRRRGLIEQAHGGTLFLDEIGEISLELQAKLLKVIEDRRLRRLGSSDEVTVDIRVIAASNRNLHDQVTRGQFRADLYHRVSVITVELPTLRERLQDLRDLVPMLVAESNARAGKHVTEISDDAWRQLDAHTWPGNVRELRNVVERCVLLAESTIFPVGWMRLESAPYQATFQESPGTSDPAPAPAPNLANGIVIPLDGSMSLDEIEQMVIRAALERSADNVTGAARLLGCSRETLRYRVEKYGLKSDR
jgi:DNA-binding NtrC family response regulator